MRFSKRLPVSLLALVAIALMVPAPAAAQEEAETEFSAAGVKKFRKEQRRPVSLGTSAGNINDFELDPPFILCTSGTAGALLEMDDRFFVVSNNHVFSMVNRGRVGDPIVQPGLIDAECEGNADDPIATFSAHKRIKFGGRKNRVDLAIAEVVDGAVKTNGKILRIGIPGNGTLDAFIGLPVKKSGRTTGFTRGEVSAILVDGTVEFDDRDALFINQIVVSDVGNQAFSDGGDSGSMVYEDVKRCPRAVGLLFAGAESFTAVNPIDEVLKFARRLRPKGEKTLVGCDSQPAPFAAVSEREQREIRRVARVKHRASEWVRGLEGVTAIGVGRDAQDPDRIVVKIFVERLTSERLARLPTELEGVPTQVVESGRFRAF